MSRPSFHRSRRRAFTLVVVLIVLSLLALISVGFLSSMSEERATASAFASKTRAEQMAQAAVDTATGSLRDYFRAFPDSATAWDTTQSVVKLPDGTFYNNEGTTLYLRAVPAGNGAATLPDPAPNLSDPNYDKADFNGGNGPNNIDSTGADKRKTFVLPLISGAKTKLLEYKKFNSGSVDSGAVPDLTADTAYDLNHAQSSKDTQGWIGTPADYGKIKPVYVPWVEIKQQDAVKSTADAPVIGRYAFWVEDESFRANLSYAGTGTGDAHARSDNTANVALTPKDMNVLGLLGYLADRDPIVNGMSLVNAREGYPGKLFPESRAYAHTEGLAADSIDKMRFLTTAQSSALNLSRHGTQRLNLNSVFYPPTEAQYKTVQNQIDKVVKTIQFHAPNFGQRFYRKNWSGTPPVVSAADLNKGDMVPAAHALIYLYKIAANLRDYIDADKVPTVIEASNGGKPGQVWQEGRRPIIPINFDDGDNPIWAVGKDSAPFMQECAVRFTGSATGTDYTINVDYYIEFWNMGTRTITGQDLGKRPFIRINNPPQWLADNKSNVNGTRTPLLGASPLLSDVKGRDFDIDISGAVFPAGSITVITTDPDWKSAVQPPDKSVRSIADPDAANQAEALKHFVYCPFLDNGKRTFTGKFPPNCNEARMIYRSGSGPDSAPDYETELVIGNNDGYIDSLAGGISMNGGIISMPVGNSPRPVYGGYIRGNLASTNFEGGLQPSAPGDPRSNNEQLFFLLKNSSNPADETRYKNFDLTSTNYQIPPTFGLPNIYSIAPAKPRNPWGDFYWFPGSQLSPGSGATAVMKSEYAVMTVANDKLLSIAQLGDIYDPARLSSNSGSDIKAVHGGGRTLKIGQHDDRYDGTNNSASSSWASWRLTDFFATSDAIEQPGLININGIARDNGAALRSAYQAFKFQPKTLAPSDAGYDPMMRGDPTISAKGGAFSTQGLQDLIDDLKKRLTNTDITKPGPFFERGELSEAPILNPVTSGLSSLVDGVDIKDVFDSGREELVRRIMEMTTTRGNVFTVYAVGQAINQTTKTKQVTGTHQLRVTFKLVPMTVENKLFHPATDDSGKLSDFSPDDKQQIAKRFAKPDHYDIEILSSSSGNL